MPAFTPPTPRSVNQHILSLFTWPRPRACPRSSPPCCRPVGTQRKWQGAGQMCACATTRSRPSKHRTIDLVMYPLSTHPPARQPLADALRGVVKALAPALLGVPVVPIKPPLSPSAQPTHNTTQDITKPNTTDKLLTAAPAGGWAAAASARTCAGAARARRSSPTPSSPTRSPVCVCRRRCGTIGWWLDGFLHVDGRRSVVTCVSVVVVNVPA